MASPEPTVHLLCGLPGAGKTTYARGLAEELPAVRFSLDEWMLRLGHDVVLDWNQWSRARRAHWRDTAQRAGCQVLLHHVDVPVEVAVARARERRNVAGSHDIDEAGVRHLARIFEPPTEDEGIPFRTVS